MATPQDLYKDIRALLTRHCRSVLANLQRLPPAEPLLAGYLQAYHSFFTGMVAVAQISAYLSRHWIKQQLAMCEGAGPHNMDCPPKRWAGSPRITVQCAPRASNGPNHLGLCALQAAMQTTARSSSPRRECCHSAASPSSFGR